MNDELAWLTTAVNVRFGRNLQQVLQEKKISQRRLAQEMGTTQTSVYDRLHGRARWQPAEVIWLPRWLGVPLEELLDG